MRHMAWCSVRGNESDGPGQPGGTPHQFSSVDVESMPALCSDLLWEKKGGSDCRKIHLWNCGKAHHVKMSVAQSQEVGGIGFSEDPGFRREIGGS